MGFSLILRNLVFTILQPGLVAGFIPYWIVGNNLETIIHEPFGVVKMLSLSIFILGFVTMALCIVRFGTHGRGTLSPADPTKFLVTSGLYQYSRNPMYVGVMLLLVSESLFCSSKALWQYSFGVFMSFNVFIMFWEEPRLTRDFGASYVAYCKKVRRWL